jgi:hypothetical protein
MTIGRLPVLFRAFSHFRHLTFQFADIYVSRDGRDRPQKVMKISIRLSYRQQSGGVDRRCMTLENVRPYVSLTLERIG